MSYYFENYLDESGNFNPALLGKEILNYYPIKTTRDNETVYTYSEKKGIWEPNGEALVKSIMAKILKLELRARHYPDVIFYIKANTFFDIPEPIPHLIAVKNGILNVETRDLIPFSYELFLVTQLPVTYDEKATSQKIQQFLQDVFTLDLMPLVQETIGYLLYQAMAYHKATMLVGNGANGKSTFLNLVTAFLGKNNISTEPLQNLCNNRFASAELFGKLANISADLPPTKLINTGVFKMLTGNDTVQAERKFKQPFSFTNTSKLLFSANQMPETLDDTAAFFRRWNILPCNNVFTGEKCNPKILEELTTPEELSGLLNWALDGLNRLLDTGRFSTSEDLDELRAQYIRKSNSAKAYIEEKLDYSNDSEDIIPEAELYQKFVFFCQNEGLPSLPKGAFTQAMHQYLPQAQQTDRRIGSVAC